MIKRGLILSTLSVLFLISLSILLAFKRPDPKLKVKWEQLFNGKDLTDWTVKIRKHQLNENFGNTFRVVDHKIQVSYDQYEKFDDQFGHLFYKKPFSYYLIGVEYRFTGNQVKGGPGWAFRNSGIMIHGQDPKTMKVDQDFPISIEVQLLGGNGKDKRPTANVCTPGTQYVLNNSVVKSHCLDSKSETFHGDQWVRVEALVLGDSLVVHYVNGEEVLRYQRPQLDPVGSTEEGALLKSGTISLQSESHPVEFRKVEIVNLEKYAHDPQKLADVVKLLTAEKRIPKQ
ncbi:3-keto-disaccharide hydrolase [Mucilaginibacter sp. R-33]|uniref:3-keto-disaccharide hydrolase n=1 Tax=Mucilaginibacter sp. R-33 TaxID=3416711 RepID=UPI003CF8C6B3